VWAERIDPVMRQEHRAGETLHVDWAGMTVPIVDPLTGSTQPASIFVAVLPASNYSYAEAKCACIDFFHARAVSHCFLFVYIYLPG
jgi:transposase